MTTATLIGTVLFWATALLDVKSTRDAIAAGRTEANPVVRAVGGLLGNATHPSVLALLLVKAGGYALFLGLLWALKAETDVPVWAELLIWCMPAALAAWAARRNWRLSRAAVVLLALLAAPAIAQQATPQETTKRLHDLLTEAGAIALSVERTTTQLVAAYTQERTRRMELEAALTAVCEQDAERTDPVAAACALIEGGE